MMPAWTKSSHLLELYHVWVPQLRVVDDLCLDILVDIAPAQALHGDKFACCDVVRQLYASKRSSSQFLRANQTLA